jgi:VanZ family protein
MPLMLVAVVAVLDEFNQSFWASRTSSVFDVLIDIAGGAVMTGTLWLLGRPRLSTDDVETEDIAEVR